MTERIWDERQYKKWRLDVYKRDNFQCQFPNCPHPKKNINAHHIKPWSEYPELRFVLINGITLCQKHHKLVTGKEDEYVPLLTTLNCSKDTIMDIIAARYKKKD